MTRIDDVIVTPNGECDIYIGPDEHQIKLGLIVPPEGFTTTFAPFASVYEPWTTDQIRRVIDSEEWTPAREIFGPEWIKDQDGRGACQGYASASALERIRHSAGLDHVELSGDAAYALVNGGRDSGSMLYKGLEAAQETGYPPADLVPRWEYRKNRIPQTAWLESPRFRAFEGYQASTEAELYTGLAMGFYGVNALHVGRSFGSLDKYGVSLAGNGRGNHAVCMDDLVYDRQMGGFKIDEANSWKISWGDNGRAFFTFRRHMRTTIEHHKFYLFRGATMDPDNNPLQPIKVA